MTTYKTLTDGNFKNEIEEAIKKAVLDQETAQISQELSWISDHIKHRLSLVESLGLIGSNTNWAGMELVKCRLFFFSYSQAHISVYYSISRNIFISETADTSAHSQERLHRKYKEFRQSSEADFFKEELRSHILGGIDQEIIGYVKARLRLVNVFYEKDGVLAQEGCDEI